jgi:ankyrin repeat protein
VRDTPAYPFVAPPPTQAQGGLEQISRPNTFQNSPLHEACICASEPVVSHLLSKGAQVDMPNKRGSTPLLFAVYCDKPSRGVVQALLNAGANAKHVDEDGVGVLHICALKNHVELLRMFMEQGVTPEPDKAGNSPAFYAKMKGHKDALRVLGEPEE